MKKLIVNADDFGLTDGVSRGIVEAIETGVVCTTSALPCFPGAEEHLQRYAPGLKERIGAHLQLTAGIPCLPPDQVPSLVDGTGHFPRRPENIGKPKEDEVYLEWRAQVQRLRSLGIEPTHLDTHHHVHKRPDLFPALFRLGRDLKLPVRTYDTDMTTALRRANIPCADFCLSTWYYPSPSPATLLELLKRAFEKLGGRGLIELMTHPGHADPDLSRVSTYVLSRETEHHVLTSSELIRGLRNKDIALTHW